MIHYISIKEDFKQDFTEFVTEALVVEELLVEVKYWLLAMIVDYWDTIKGTIQI